MGILDLYSERGTLICRYCSRGAGGAGVYPPVQLPPRTASVCDDKKKVTLMCLHHFSLSLSHALIKLLSGHISKPYSALNFTVLYDVYEAV